MRVPSVSATSARDADATARQALRHDGQVEVSVAVSVDGSVHVEEDVVLVEDGRGPGMEDVHREDEELDGAGPWEAQ